MASVDVRHKLVTFEEFEVFILLPENTDKIFELIGGVLDGDDVMPEFKLAAKDFFGA